MKHILFLFVFLCSLVAGTPLITRAQIPPIADSIADKDVTLQFKGKQHGLIYSFMPDRGDPDAINYVNQLADAVAAKNLRDSAGRLVFDTAQLMTVTVKYRLVDRVIRSLGGQPERLTAQDNEELRRALDPQLRVAKYIDLLMVIGAIFDQNKKDTEKRRQEGIDLIMKIKP